MEVGFLRCWLRRTAFTGKAVSGLCLWDARFTESFLAIREPGLGGLTAGFAMFERLPMGRLSEATGRVERSCRFFGDFFLCTTLHPIYSKI